MCTTLENKSGTKVSTVEHLLAALYVSEIDNAVIEIDSEEVPIMDGSARNFVEIFKKTELKTLNKKKGRAVWSPRAQVDKRVYENKALHLLKSSGCQIFSGEVVSLTYKNHKVTGVSLRSGERLKGSSVIITSGTFLSGLIHVGDRKIRAGRMGEDAHFREARGLVPRRGSNSGGPS